MAAARSTVRAPSGAAAQTGTGKTAGFALPLLQKLTLEAAQVEESVRQYGKYLDLNSTVVFGGVGMNPQIDRIKRAVKQEERHVEFGESQTRKTIEGKAWLRRRLLGLSLVSMWGVSRIAGFMHKRLPADHPVLRHLPEFLAFANRCAETRLRRIGVLDRPLAELGGGKRALLVAEAYAGKAAGGLVHVLTTPLRLLPFWPKKKRLTDSYLADPHIAGYQLADGGGTPDEAASRAAT